MNWNDYFDSEHHVKVMKDSIAEEKQAKKKLEDLMHTEEHINKTRTEMSCKVRIHSIKLLTY